jgi:hypothetical protein
MANVLNRTTKEFRRSVNTPDYPVENWIINPDLSSLIETDSKYWIVEGDTVRDMTDVEKDVVDANEASAAEAAAKTAAKAVIDGADPIMNKTLTAIAEVIQDELQALKNNTPLASRTMDQLKQAAKDKIDG